MKPRRRRVSIPETLVAPTLVELNPMATQTQAQEQGKGVADVLAEIDRLRAENARLQAQQVKSVGRITVKRSKAEGATKGNALCVYGLGRYPVTLYREQAEALCRPEVVAEILAMAKTLPTKVSDEGKSSQSSGF
jgi:hypothetical protein